MQRSTIPLALLVGLGLSHAGCGDRILSSDSDGGSGDSDDSSDSSGATISTSAPSSTSATPGTTAGTTLDTTSSAPSTSASSLPGSDGSGPYFDIGDSPSLDVGTDDPPVIPEEVCQPLDSGETSTGTDTAAGTSDGTSTGGVPPEDVEACLDCFEQGYCWDQDNGLCDYFRCWDPEEQECFTCGPCLGLMPVKDDDAAPLDASRGPASAAALEVLERVLERGDLPDDVRARLRDRRSRGR